MTDIELITMFKSIKTLHDVGHTDKAMKILEDAIEMAEGKKVKPDNPKES